MAKRIDRPEQLHLDLQLDYLNRLANTAERFDSYESTSRVLLKSKPRNTEKSPVWKEINTSLW